MRVAVAGGTGQVGSRVVARLREQGDDVVVLSRGNGVDLLAGDGVRGALEGVEALVDCTSTAATTRTDTTAFFGTVARRLQEAAGATGVRRIVTLSIVGIDAMPDQPHYAGKLAQEAVTKAGPVPATILRATQFHTFGGSLLAWMRKGPFVPAPTYPVQTVDLGPVAANLVRLAGGQDEGGTVNLAGPQRLPLSTVVRRTARARGQRVFVVPVPWLPGAWARAARDGAALAPDDALIEGPSFDEWIAAGAPSEQPA